MRTGKSNLWVFYHEDEKGNRTEVSRKYLLHPRRSVVWKRLEDKINQGMYHCVGYERVNV